MNALAKNILTLSSYDTNAMDVSIPNVLRQSIELIANFPALAVYSYQAYRHYELGKDFISTSQSRSFPLPRIFCASCVRINLIPIPKQKCST